MVTSVAQRFSSSSVTLAASANTAPVTGCSWGGDAPNVLSVNAGTGQITGMASGEVTVWCDYQGVRGTKRLRVLPNYGGVYLGSYSVSGCNHSRIFDAANWCGSFNTGRALPLRFDFSQTTDSQWAHVDRRNYIR